MNWLLPFSYCRVLFRDYVLDAPAVAMDAIVQFMVPAQLSEGIRLIDPVPETRRVFTTLVGEALKFLAEVDPVRFRRASREIRSIVNAPAFEGCLYARPLRVCSLDLRCYYYPGDRIAAREGIAAAVVRAATRGYLQSHGILCVRENRARIDRIYCGEEQRFLQQFGTVRTVEAPHGDVGPHDTR